MALPEVDVKLIDRAARQQGRGRTEFVRAAAVLAAEQALLEAQFVRVTPAGIAGLGKPVRQLAQVLARTAPWGEQG